MDTPLKVLIADDHPLVLQGIRRALEDCDDMEVVGEAKAGDELLSLVERRNPDLVLLDLQMPGRNGIECVAEIAERHPRIKTVILSASEDRSTIDQALLAGASAYVVKSVSPVDIPSALRQAASGAIFHAPSPGPRASAPVAPEASPTPLTERERAILAAVAGGLTTKAISEQLWLSQHTVKFHLTNIYRKLGVANRSAAVRYAFEHGLAGPPSDAD